MWGASYLRSHSTRSELRAAAARDRQDVSEGEKIHFNRLHEECHSRIQYKKTCPIHGEVKQDEIVSGFEYSKGQYVVVDPAELDKLRTEDEKAITINTFIAPDAIGPLYYMTDQLTESHESISFYQAGLCVSSQRSL